MTCAICLASQSVSTFCWVSRLQCSIESVMSYRELPAMNRRFRLQTLDSEAWSPEPGLCPGASRTPNSRLGALCHKLSWGPRAPGFKMLRERSPTDPSADLQTPCRTPFFRTRHEVVTDCGVQADAAVRRQGAARHGCKPEAYSLEPEAQNARPTRVRSYVYRLPGSEPFDSVALAPAGFVLAGFVLAGFDSLAGGEPAFWVFCAGALAPPGGIGSIRKESSRPRP